MQAGSHVGQGVLRLVEIRREALLHKQQLELMIMVTGLEKSKREGEAASKGPGKSATNLKLWKEAFRAHLYKEGAVLHYACSKQQATPRR